MLRQLLIGSFLVFVLLMQSVAAQMLAIKAERMLDVRSGEMQSPVLLLVSNGKIVAVNPSSLPKDVDVIDLGDQTILPGLIDMHTHITGDYFTGDDWTTAAVRQT
jgi:imidazolonepropionase-like amidohydrolase